MKPTKYFDASYLNAVLNNYEALSIRLLGAYSLFVLRFSLLLLDPGEIYFEDFSAFLFSGSLVENDYENKKEIGRLKLCSKSIVFDPKDVMSPIIKIPFKECAKISEWDDNHACT